uniref:Aminotransferase class I/classII large domain-containing protein n=1 Tax=Clastoptera arizonana TaxID=38151 RepID=A0A1B6D250_9HEMI
MDKSLGVKKIFSSLHTICRKFQYSAPNNNVKIEYDIFLNDVSRRRMPSIMRETTQVISKMSKPPISFGVGVPNVSTFPFEKMKIKLKNGSTFSIEDDELKTALQYLPSQGYGPLILQLKDIQDYTHGTQNWNSKGVMVTTGGQEPLFASLQMCLNPGIAIIIPHPLYPGSLDAITPMNPNIIAIEQDKYGLRVDQLQERLEECRSKGGPLPKVMYINPTACNPSGMTVPLDRKKVIYNLACEYNFLILEDDPYYFLNFLPKDPESFLSIDTEGRVIRMDSFSKILSSGLRIGFVTAPIPLLRRIELHMQVSTLHTSGVSQVIVNKLLTQWGKQGFEKHIKEVKAFYREKKDRLIHACSRHLKDLAEWEEPTGGMFIWVKIKGLDNVYYFATKTCIGKHLVIIPGHAFLGIDPSMPCSYVRLSYSLAEPWEVEKGCKLLADLIREELKIKK